MGALAAAVRTRHDHHVRLIRARQTSDELFQILREEAFFERPIAERHRVIFYLGHMEAFDWNLLTGESARSWMRRSSKRLIAQVKVTPNC